MMCDGVSEAGGRGGGEDAMAVVGPVVHVPLGGNTEGALPS
jgi:hypothetical protein